MADAADFLGKVQIYLLSFFTFCFFLCLHVTILPYFGSTLCPPVCFFYVCPSLLWLSVFMSIYFVHPGKTFIINIIIETEMRFKSGKWLSWNSENIFWNVLCPSVRFFYVFPSLLCLYYNYVYPFIFNFFTKLSNKEKLCIATIQDFKFTFLFQGRTGQLFDSRRSLELGTGNRLA